MVTAKRGTEYANPLSGDCDQFRPFRIVRGRGVPPPGDQYVSPMRQLGNFALKGLDDESGQKTQHPVNTFLRAGWFAK